MTPTWLCAPYCPFATARLANFPITFLVRVATVPKQQDRLICKLIEKLHDADPLTRRNAAGALRLHGSRAIDALSSLEALLDDNDHRVRVEAERAVDRLRIAAA